MFPLLLIKVLPWGKCVSFQNDLLYPLTLNSRPWRLLWRQSWLHWMILWARANSYLKKCRNQRKLLSAYRGVEQLTILQQSLDKLHHESLFETRTWISGVLWWRRSFCLARGFQLQSVLTNALRMLGICLNIDSAWWHTASKCNSRRLREYWTLILTSLCSTISKRHPAPEGNSLTPDNAI